MILVVAIALGCVLSLARRGRRAFGEIADLPLRAPWLALLAVALQLPLLRSPGGPTEHLLVPRALFVVSNVLLLGFIWQNRRQIGILILGAGILCNFLAMVANGGLMPITPETLIQINPGTEQEQWSLDTHYGSSKDVIQLQEETRLWVLSDILVLPPPCPWPTAFSLGDLLIAVGVLVFLQGGISQPYAADPQFC